MMEHIIKRTLPTCVCSIFILLLLAALFLNPHSTVFSRAIDSNPAQYDMGVIQTKSATLSILNYLWFNSRLDVELSKQAILHLSDVQCLFVAGQIMILIFGLLTYVLLKKKTSLQRVKIFLWSTASAVVATLLLLLFSAFGFTSLFLSFHQIVFTNDLWLFPATDSLIKYFPQYFFESVVTQLTLWLLLTLSVIFLLLKLEQRRERLSSSKPTQHI